MRAKIIDRFVDILKRFYRCRSRNKMKDSVLFIPHSGMCRVDRYSVINYKSDSALSFLHYILENNLLLEKRLVVAIANDMDTKLFDNYVAEHYPNRNLSYLPMFTNIKLSKVDKLHSIIQVCKCIGSCSHIFSSISEDYSKSVSKDQVLIDLNYYTCSMKNDILDSSSQYYMGLENAGHEYTYVVGTSELAIRLILPEMTIPYNKYVNLGMCRNDNVLNGDKCDWLRNEILKKVRYKVNKIILYTPTHRDYESALKSGNRSVLGFDYNADDIQQFLNVNGIVFICKLHPKQNALIVEKDLPEGLLLHKPDERYGLTELMQVSDALVTDYTSAYFDYLLLDKPVIFNFYDLELYKKERGVPFEPMSAIAAGEIVENVEEMKKALLDLDNNAINNKQKRAFVRDLFFTMQDTKSCERVYKFIFGK